MNKEKERKQVKYGVERMEGRKNYLGLSVKKRNEEREQRKRYTAQIPRTNKESKRVTK